MSKKRNKEEKKIKDGNEGYKSVADRTEADHSRSDGINHSTI